MIDPEIIDRFRVPPRGGKIVGAIQYDVCHEAKWTCAHCALRSSLITMCLLKPSGAEDERAAGREGKDDAV
jgi:hypothetical protein